MGFRQDLKEETVDSLPLRDAIAVDPHTVIRAAIALMRSHSLGCAVVIDEDGRPQGIFTEQSVIKLLMQNAMMDDLPVSEFADREFVVARKSDPIAKVWDAISSDGNRFVCVVDDDGRLMGLTGQRGIAEYVADCFARQVVVQRLGGTPWMQSREGA